MIQASIDPQNINSRMLFKKGDAKDDSVVSQTEVRRQIC